MNNRLWTVLALIFLSALPTQAADSRKLFPAEAAITDTRVMRFTSAITGEPFTIQVWFPFGFAGKPPKAGYSVLYVLDGEPYFPLAQYLSGALPGLSPIVVGIGHDAMIDKTIIAKYAIPVPKDASKLSLDDANNAFSHFRFMDFTTPVALANLGPIWLGGGGNYHGGDVDKFLRVIETEIKPRVAAMVPINAADQALYGHSLGGFAVIRALFTEPNAFHAFIASSPTLWWNRDEILKSEAGFEDKIRSGAASPRVMITAAAEEPEISINSDYLKSLPPDKAAEIAPYLKKLGSWSGMKSGSRALADRLKKISGKPGYAVKYELIPGLDHGSEPQASIWDGLNFAFRQ